MKKRILFTCLFSLFFYLSVMGIVHAADESIAEVLTMVPGASLTRDGKNLPLKQFAKLRVSDTISTNATGRARILFNDDSTVDLGANTSLDMRDFADSGARSVCDLHLLQGVARVITGKIVERNPGGFAVSTPEGTIGIRGTILSVRTGKGITTVYVENTTRAVYVNNINVPGGQKLTIPSDSIRPEPILPQDRRNLGRDLAFRGGAGVAAAAPEPYQDSGRPEEQLRGGTTHLVAERNLIPPDTSLADVSIPTQSLGDSLIAGLTASVSGTLSSAMSGNSFSGNFGFSVALATGSISGATLTGMGVSSGPYSGNFTINYHGGTGSLIPIGGSTFAVMGNYAAGAGTTTTFIPMAATSILKTDMDITTVPNGGSVTVLYSIVDSSNMTFDHGAGAGTLTK
ncbi:MAG: FecR family protein [Desulfovibrio sp.]|nr:FecR family protein [Desulfovibrio sp.]